MLSPRPPEDFPLLDAHSSVTSSQFSRCADSSKHILQANTEALFCCTCLNGNQPDMLQEHCYLRLKASKISSFRIHVGCFERRQ